MREDTYILITFLLLLVQAGFAQSSTRSIGFKNFEVSNHLNNITEVTSDRKVASNLGKVIAYNEPDVLSFTDYYPYGMQQENRSNSGDYKYGFQGQEKDDKVKGEGNSINYKYRMHDPRVGRFFAVDPLSLKYPHNSSYAFSENIILNAIELEGLEKYSVFLIRDSFGSILRAEVWNPNVSSPQTRAIRQYINTDWGSTGIYYANLNENYQDISAQYTNRYSVEEFAEGSIFDKHINGKTVNLVEGGEVSIGNALLSDSEVIMGSETKKIRRYEITLRGSYNVNFDFADTSVTNEDQSGMNDAVDAYANVLVKNPRLSLTVEGHTDSKGTNNYNQNLSLRRANTIRRMIANKARSLDPNFDRSRIQAAGFGEARPVAPNTNDDGTDNPEGRSQNRRIEIQLNVEY